MDGADYAARIEAARTDADELGRIADELQSSAAPDSQRLRNKAVALRFILRRSSGALRRPLGTAPAAAAAAAELPQWLADLQLPAIDGRPLHAYRLRDDRFSDLQAKLKARASALMFAPDKVLAAQFVLWAAEWFRRCYDGTGQRWDALGVPLELRGSWTNYRKLTDIGLRHWRIPELRINGTHHRLAAIARQGGFPLAAIEGKGAGWAPRFLERLVGALLAEPDASLDVAERIASSLMVLVPETWRNQEIKIVSAELATEIVRLRRLADAEGAPEGSLTSLWLDRHHPAWRDELPVGVSSEAGRSLIDGLMRTAVLRGGTGAVGLRRLLTLTSDGRRELVELKLTGTLNDVEGRAISRNLGEDWSRLRLFPSGEFARHVAGELATADPDEEGTWTARPSTTRSRFDLPLSIAVTAELRGGGARVGEPFGLPGGDAVPPGVRVYVADGDQGVNDRLELTLLGVGSGGYRPDRLHVDVPRTWTCAAHDELSTSELLAGGSQGERSLWIVEGAALVTSERGDRYLVRAGQKGEHRDRLFILGTVARECSSVDPTLPLFVGAPAFRLRDGNRERMAAPGELVWRAAGAAGWQANALAPSHGQCEFAWRDEHSGHIRARGDAVVLPAAFAIESRRVGEWLNLTVSGWPGRMEMDGGAKVGLDTWRFPTRATTRSSTTLRLLVDGRALVEISIALPHQSWIDDWSAGPLQRGSRISLSTINRFVARADGRCELLADLLGRNRRPMVQGISSWWVDGELPMSTVRDDLAALLRPLGDIRATVRLKFNDGHEDFWFVEEFEHILQKEGRGWCPDRAVVEGDVRIVGRALAQPAAERDFGSYGLLASGMHRPFEIPTLHGDWLVYLRANERVLSCPQFIRGRDMAVAPTTALGRAMAVQEREPRLAAIVGLIDDTLGEPTSRESRELVKSATDLALSLDGMPPATFDVLALICDRPLLGTMMLFHAAAKDLDALVRLTEGLPMAWSLVHVRCWEEAAAALAEYLFETAPDEPLLVARMVSDRRKAIAEQEPVLAPLLGLKSEHDGLVVASNAFLNRSDDRIQDMQNPFRRRHADLLPAWGVGEHFWRALDAPVAAALSAMQRVELDDAEIRCVKDIGRRHPRWFREAFAATLEEYR
ncbi:STY4851/ECs_5259 family protein [Sphingomonas sp. UYP23]